MDIQEFLEHIKEEMVIEDREISLDDVFRDYPEWSSLTFLSLITMVDEEFDFVLKLEDIEGCVTLSDLWDYINKSI